MSEENVQETVEETAEPIEDQQEPISDDDDFDLAEELGNSSSSKGDIEDGLDEDEEDAEEESDGDDDDSTEEESEGNGEEEENTESNQDSEKYTLKINGEEQEFTLDQLKQMASKVKGSDQKFYEASEGRRKLQEVVNTLGDDPWQVLEKMGKDPVEMAEKFLADHYKLEMMSDEEKEVYRIKKENEQFKREKELTARQQQEQALAEATAQAKAKYEAEFKTALEEKELPNNPATMKRMANYIQEGLKTGVEINASEAASLVAEDIMNESKQILSQMEIDKLEAVLGKDVVKKLKKHELAKIKDPRANNRANTNAPRKRKGKAPKMKQLSSIFDDIESTL